MSKKIIIAIDGYASTGKSSFAKVIASRLGYKYIDSGALYRCITLYGLRNGLITPTEGIRKAELIAALPGVVMSFMQVNGENHATLNGEDVEAHIRNMEVSGWVSPISEIPEVRARVDEHLHLWGEEKGIVMDGRDIGTAVFPQAELKIFMTASAEVRAGRRLKEMQEKGMETSFEAVMENIRCRDWQDSHRETHPLRRAQDALLLDNSDMTIPQQMEWLESILVQSEF